MSDLRQSPSMRVLVYSDDRSTRERVVRALGRRPARDVPTVEIVEVATGTEVVRLVDAGGVDVAVFDGEAWPEGGMGLCRKLKAEIYDCPPVLVLLGRPQDAWLATWALADATVAHPVDPLLLADTVAELMRARSERRPVVR